MGICIHYSPQKVGQRYICCWYACILKMTDMTGVLNVVDYPVGSYTDDMS